MRRLRARVGNGDARARSTLPGDSEGDVASATGEVEHGELRVTKDGATQWLAVSGGFAQVEGDRVHVLAEHAITEEKVDEKAVEAALLRAQKELDEAKHLLNGR
mgnify:CR=1 FL=1